MMPATAEMMPWCAPLTSLARRDIPFRIDVTRAVNLDRSELQDRRPWCSDDSDDFLNAITGLMSWSG
jgi:hypothetical protein